MVILLVPYLIKVNMKVNIVKSINNSGCHALVRKWSCCNCHGSVMSLHIDNFFVTSQLNDNDNILFDHNLQIEITIYNSSENKL